MERYGERIIGLSATLLPSMMSDKDDSAKQWRRLLWFPLTLSATLLIFPQLTFVTMSFHRDIGMGQVSADFTIANYVKILTDVFYLRAIWETTYLSACATFWRPVGFSDGIIGSRSRRVATLCSPRSWHLAHHRTSIAHGLDIILGSSASSIELSRRIERHPKPVAFERDQF
jgi:hypothetical protein